MHVKNSVACISVSSLISAILDISIENDCYVNEIIKPFLPVISKAMADSTITMISFFVSHVMPIFANNSKM